MHLPPCVDEPIHDCSKPEAKDTALPILYFVILGRIGGLVLTTFLVLVTRCAATDPVWPERLQYRLALLADSSLSNDTDLAQANQFLEVAATNGYNGIVLASSANLIQPQTAGNAFLDRLQSLREEATSLGIGLIPSVMPFDSDDVLRQLNPIFAEGLPVRDALYVVDGSEACLRPDPPIKLVNCGFETAGPDGVPGWRLVGLQPGRTITVDTNHALYGDSSLRFTNVESQTPNLGYRATQKVRLPAFRLFRLTVWTRSDDPNGDTCFYFGAHANGRFLGLGYLGQGEAGVWRQHTVLFNSLYGGEIEILLGLHDTKSRSHTIWFDNLEIQHIGLTNVIRRAGCPISVRNERGRAYEEHRDYEIGNSAKHLKTTLGDGLPTAGLPLELSSRTRIHDGERLRVSFFSSPPCLPCPASLCPNCDEVYHEFADGVQVLREELAPFGYHLATRYLSNANWDEACLNTKKTPGAQWGRSLRRQATILAKGHSRPVCFVWSDMYEPWHNPYSQFWLANGTFEDAWKYLPRDFVVLNARHAAEDSRSPLFFAANGYSQVIAGDVAVGNWMQEHAGMPGIVGVLNTGASLEKFAAAAWGWLPEDVQTTLPPAPIAKLTEGKRTRPNSPPEAEMLPAPTYDIRTWTSADGLHTVEARFVRINGRAVTLFKPDGTEITIDIAALSEEDRHWLRLHTEKAHAK